MPVDRKGQRPLVHVQKNAQNSLPLKNTAVSGALCVRMMPELANSKEGPSEFVVTKSGSLVALAALTDSNFELVLGPRVGDDLPVVDALGEGYVAEERAEEVVVFF